jgi:hypothetical protein
MTTPVARPPSPPPACTMNTSPRKLHTETGKGAPLEAHCSSEALTLLVRRKVVLEPTAWE